MGSSKSYRGAGPKGAEEQDAKGPGMSRESRSRTDDTAFGTQPAASGR